MGNLIKSFIPVGPATGAVHRAIGSLFLCRTHDMLDPTVGHSARSATMCARRAVNVQAHVREVVRQRSGVGVNAKNINAALQ